MRVDYNTSVFLLILPVTCDEVREVTLSFFCHYLAFEPENFVNHGPKVS